MSPAGAGCPSCGAEIVFKTASAVVMRCEFCGVLVSRLDRKLEEIGKVAPVTETSSPLRLELRGAEGQNGFVLRGHLQLGHAAGGRWDEWLAAFDDGTWGWIAEAMGRFFLTRRVEATERLPAFETLQPAQRLAIAGISFTVQEAGEARLLAAEGELPESIEPGAEFRYADLSAAADLTATIDYSDDPPRLYLGREVTLGDLGLQGATAISRPLQQVAVSAMNCPQCAGSISLAAPDRSERVACQHCGALLDVRGNALAFLVSLAPLTRPPQLPLGTEGTLDEVRWRVIGYMVRSVVFDAVRYPWEEYLLYAPERGFSWLTCSDGHWSLVKNVAAGKVDIRNDGNAFCDGVPFRRFQRAVATVDELSGEFYWQVEVGERASTQDFIAPPQILSLEESVADDGTQLQAREVNASLGRYLFKPEIDEAFGITTSATPIGVGPNQPYFGPRLTAWWLTLVAVLVVGWLLLPGSTTTLYEQRFTVDLNAKTSPKRVEFTDPLRFEARKNVRVTLQADVQNGWVGLDGDLYSVQTGLVAPFYIEAGYWSGIEGGERWSEGSHKQDVHLSALPAGEYALHLAFDGQAPATKPVVVAVTVEQGVRRFGPFLIALALLSIGPLLAIVARYRFEIARWRDSEFNPYAKSGEEEDDDE